MSARIRSVDMLRGLTIMLMIVVNTPGSWSHVYAPLLHADWNGITPTDFVFPSFLFIVGVSIVLAMHSRIEQQPVSQTFKKIAFRSAKIYAVGIFLWIWPDFDLTHVRYVGVLPRIAIVYFICATIYLFSQRSNQLKLALVILAAYTVI
ncbi:MAG: heparan-alpha-glucosaminide N-acetyltransferase domain-containing protein, partial [Flavobacteriaceae bacterium]